VLDEPMVKVPASDGSGQNPSENTYNTKYKQYFKSIKYHKNRGAIKQ
jgi:hypothetical protein